MHDELPEAGDVAVAEGAEQLVFQAGDRFPDPGDDLSSCWCQAEQLCAAVTAVCRPFDQTFSDERVDEADQGGAFDTDRGGEILLVKCEKCGAVGGGKSRLCDSK